MYTFTKNINVANVWIYTIKPEVEKNIELKNTDRKYSKMLSS